jgi:hypothetical protein
MHITRTGAAAGLVEATREEDLLQGKEKIQFKAQTEAKNEAIIREKTLAGEGHM